MKNRSQPQVANYYKIRKMSERLSNYRSVFIDMAWRVGLTMEEVALIFGTTKQNVSKTLKKYKNHANRNT